MADKQSEPGETRWAGRLRRAALLVLFSLVLLIPKVLALRRRRRWWNALRLTAAVTGAFLFADKAGSPGQLLFGLWLLLLALFVRPAKQEKSVDEQARGLGALVALNGGRFARAGEPPRPVRLFLAPERVHVLDLEHQPLLEIPLGSVSSVRAEAVAGGWRLLISCEESPAEFHYEGFFAEHLARIAETTLRSQLHRELPVVR